MTQINGENKRAFPDKHFVFDQASAAISARDLEGTIFEWNKHAEKLYGLSKEEVIGRNISEFVAPENAGLVTEVNKAVKEGKAWEGDFVFNSPGESSRIIHATNSPLLNESGELVGVVSVAFDITERQRARQHLQAQYEIVQIAGESTSVKEAVHRIISSVCRALNWQLGQFWVVNEEGVLEHSDTWVTPNLDASEFIEFNKRNPVRKGEGMLGKVYEREAPLWVPNVLEYPDFPRGEPAAKAGLSSVFAAPLVLGNETIGVVEFYNPQIEQPDEELLEFMTALTTLISQMIQRIHIEKTIRYSEARNKATVMGALDCVITIDHEGRIIEFNPAAEEVFGYKREEVMGEVMAELLIPEQLRDAHHRGFNHYLQTGEGPILNQRLELSAVRRDGTEFPVELTITRVDLPGDPIFTGFLRDITEPKRAEYDLIETTQRFAHLAHTLQQSLLPPTLPNVEGIDIATIYRPAGEGAEIGGDFYDVFETGRGDWSILIGDVRGKGSEAATITALARHTIRTAAIQQKLPSAVLDTLNQGLLIEETDRFCTVVYGTLHEDGDGFQLNLCCGGHPRPFCLRKKGKVEPIGENGMLLGAFPDAQLFDSVVDLQKGDTVVFYTDGVTEARSPANELFGYNRLGDLLEESKGMDAEGIAAKIEQRVLEFQNGFPRDDIAILVFQVKE